MFLDSSSTRCSQINRDSFSDSIAFCGDLESKHIIVLPQVAAMTAS